MVVWFGLDRVWDQRRLLKLLAISTDLIGDRVHPHLSAAVWLRPSPEGDLAMPPALPQTAFFTVAALGLCAFTLLILAVLMKRTAANFCIAGFLACVIPAPVMLIAHPSLAVTMFGIGLAFLVPAILLARDPDDDGRGRNDDEPTPPLDPGPEPDSELWAQFERDFWAHVERARHGDVPTHQAPVKVDRGRIREGGAD